MDEDFRKELTRIVRSGAFAPLELVEVSEPSSWGWMRRSEFDQPGRLAWERPDGRLVHVREAKGPL